MRKLLSLAFWISCFFVFVVSSFSQGQSNLTYPIVHSGITKFYSSDSELSTIKQGQPFYGQDASYIKNMPSYIKNADGTVQDTITGLMWEYNMGQKMTLEEAQKKANESRLGGYSDWRVPTIKEVYSLINFTGKVMGEKAQTMFIDTNFFKQDLGDLSKGEREIDAQTWSSTVYKGFTMNNEETIFGVNFVDGRIKGYAKIVKKTNQPNKMYFRLVRGNTKYGINSFIDNGDGTISDIATGLMWQKADSAKGYDWQGALSYAENLKLSKYDDWRLPSTKELQSIVDYSRSPSSTNSAAINAMFSMSVITNPGNGSPWYPFFWTATTHLDGPKTGAMAAYICFGEAIGKMNGKILDVHGAGAQRSDPKSGNASELPQYFGPQGDIRIVYNYVRAVRYIK